MPGSTGSGRANPARVLLVDDAGAHDVFDDATVVDGIISARTPFQYEVGEELRVRVEQAGAVVDAVARVRAHVGPRDKRRTELEISEQSTPRRMVSG